VYNCPHHIAARDNQRLGDAELSEMNGQSDRRAERSHALALCFGETSVVVAIGIGMYCCRCTPQSPRLGRRCRMMWIVRAARLRRLRRLRLKRQLREQTDGDHLAMQIRGGDCRVKGQTLRDRVSESETAALKANSREQDDGLDAVVERGVGRVRSASTHGRDAWRR
jgi:hypothetical protein